MEKKGRNTTYGVHGKGEMLPLNIAKCS